MRSATCKPWASIHAGPRLADPLPDGSRFAPDLSLVPDPFCPQNAVGGKMDLAALAEAASPRERFSPSAPAGNGRKGERRACIVYESPMLTIYAQRGSSE